MQGRKGKDVHKLETRIARYALTIVALTVGIGWLMMAGIV